MASADSGTAARLGALFVFLAFPVAFLVYVVHFIYTKVVQERRAILRHDRDGVIEWVDAPPAHKPHLHLKHPFYSGFCAKYAVLWEDYKQKPAALYYMGATLLYRMLPVAVPLNT